MPEKNVGSLKITNKIKLDYMMSFVSDITTDNMPLRITINNKGLKSLKKIQTYVYGKSL